MRSSRTSGTAVLTATAAAAAALLLATAPLGAAAQNDRAFGERPQFQGEHGNRDRDNRTGSVAPTVRQRAHAARLDARVRWNDLGTPATVTAEGQPLDTGLSADPATAAREYVARNRDLLGLTAEATQSLEVVNAAPLGRGAAVLLRQSFGDLAAGVDGLVAIGMRDGQVFSVSSSLARATGVPAPATLAGEDAVRRAAADVGLDAGVVGRTRKRNGWAEYSASGLSGTQRTRLVAVPTPEDGVRAAHHVVLQDLGNEQPVALSSFVDARDGGVLVRADLVDYATDNPTWEVFTNTAPFDYSTQDTRITWCFDAGAPSCEETVGSPASPLAWDVDPATGATTNTTLGNNAKTYHNWFGGSRVGVEAATPSPTRDYAYGWTNQWSEQRCNPDTTFTSPERNDIDAARANLFAMLNRLHDWSYHLGFTETAFNLQVSNFGRGGLENDPAQGNAQAGGVAGGPPRYDARNIANQSSGPDGTAAITNIYLWQPVAAEFYGACADGDFDMSIIGHEYTHAISNRMVAGPNSGLSGLEAGAMGESWSDLMAVEYLNEHGYAPSGISAFTVGAYVTTDGVAGIRNYNMSRSPLNYSDMAYDLLGQQSHADGEIWSATNFDIREAFIARYGAGNAVLQKSCANGQLSVEHCPGNRRWVQLVFDAWLLMAIGNVSMVAARDALLAADQIRFGGANQDLLWNAFAKRGLGEGASSDSNDADPQPSFASPFATEAIVKFRPVGEQEQVISGAKLFVGHYQARAVPVADINDGTELGESVNLVPGTYEFVAQAPGRGLVRIGPVTLHAGHVRDLTVRMFSNLASSALGATATGDGVNVAKLIDDSEATNWAVLGDPVAGKQVTVDLAGGVQQVRRVQVSAMLRPPISTDPEGDTDTQNRFSALRQFRVLACTASATVDCADAAEFTPVFTSPADAFPSIAPRPRAPDLIFRSFDIPLTEATHLRLEVLTNQCTGTPDYLGDQDDDPANNTDCRASNEDENVRAAEFQAFAPHYDFGGFYSPVDNPPTFNTVRAGAAIPVKFSLAGYHGLDVLAAGSPRSRRIDCDSAAETDEIELTVSAGSGLIYDPVSDQYQYVWKSDKDWSDTCRQLDVELDDGTHHRANFRFR